MNILIKNNFRNQNTSYYILYCVNYVINCNYKWFDNFLFWWYRNCILKTIKIQTFVIRFQVYLTVLLFTLSKLFLLIQLGYQLLFFHLLSVLIVILILVEWHLIAEVSLSRLVLPSHPLQAHTFIYIVNSRHLLLECSFVCCISRFQIN